MVIKTRSSQIDCMYNSPSLRFADVALVDYTMHFATQTNNCDASTTEVISNSVDIDFIHDCFIHGV